MSEEATRCSSVVSRIAHQACFEAPVSRLRQPWWEHLDPDFYSSEEGFDLARRDRALVAACRTLDTGIRTAGALTVGALAVPLGYNPVRLRRDLEDAEIYTRIAESHDPTRFFAEPSRPAKVRLRTPRVVQFRPRDGVCEELLFPSAFVPVNPRLRGRYGNGRNSWAHARHWRHHRGPRPTVIALHGFYADGFLLNERLFEIRLLYELGCDVLLFTLPFHGSRQSLLSPFSGHGFFSGGAAAINEAFAQAVHDVQAFITYLEDERGVERFGVTGISLGGYTSALLAAIEPRLEFALPNVPVATIPDLLLEWPPLSQVMRTLLRLNHVDIVAARRLMAVHSPLTYTPLLPRDRLMVIGGVGDRLAPPKHSRLLWEHWERCHLHWFPGSHVLHLDKGDYLIEIEKFFKRIGFLD